MSIIVMAAVMKNLGLKPAEKSILGIYASFSDDNGGSIYPSHETVCLYTSYHRTSVIETTQELINKGVLVKVGKASRGQNEYRIDLTALTVLEVNAPLKHLQAISDKRKNARSRANHAKDPEPAPVLPAPNLSPETTPLTPEAKETPPKVENTLSPEATRLMVNKGFKDLKELKDLNNLSAEKNLSFENEQKPVTDQEPKPPKPTKTDIPKPPKFWEFKTVYDQNAANAKTHPWGIMQIQDLAEMVTRLNSLYVDPIDFENAIIKQDQDPTYHHNGPLSYEKRAWNEKNLRTYGHYRNPKTYPPRNRTDSVKAEDLQSYMGWEPTEIDTAGEITQGEFEPKQTEPIPGSEAYEFNLWHSMGITEQDIQAAIEANPGKKSYLLRFEAIAERNKRLAKERAPISVFAEV